MKKMLALFCCTLLCRLGHLPRDPVVRWKTIVGNITVSNNDAVGGNQPWDHSLEHASAGRASVNLATGYVSFDVDGLVFEWLAMPPATPDGWVDSSRGLADLRCGPEKDQTIFTTTPVPLNAQGNADFFREHSRPFRATCTNPPLSDPNWPRSFRAPTSAGSLRERVRSFWRGEQWPQLSVGTFRQKKADEGLRTASALSFLFAQSHGLLRQA